MLRREKKHENTQKSHVGLFYDMLNKIQKAELLVK